MTAVSVSGSRARGGASNAVLSTVARYLLPTGSDDSVQVQTAINALGGYGVVVLGPGVFQWNAEVVQLPRNATGVKVVGSGEDVTTIRLSNNAPRAFDFGKVADYDVFQNLELSDFTVDCNGIGGQHHVVVGTYIRGVVTTRISVNKFRLRRIATINVPTDQTMVNHRLNVYIMPQFNTADTPGTVNDHVYEDLTFLSGGNYGLGVGATAASGQSSCTWDRITVERVKHDTTQIATVHYQGNNIQIGAQGPGGRVVVNDCYGVGAGDTGIEVDNATQMIVSNCRAQDATRQQFEVAGIGVPIDGTDKQTILFDNCSANLVSFVETEGSGNPAMGFHINFNNTAPAGGSVLLRDCKYNNETAQAAFSPSGGPGYASAVHMNGALRHIVLDRFQAYAENLALAPADSQIPQMICINPTGTSRVLMRNCLIKLGGTMGGGTGTAKWYLVAISGAQAGDIVDVDIDGIDYDLGSVTGGASCPLVLGQFSSASGQMRGTIKRLNVLSSGDANNPVAQVVTVFSSTYLTITPELLFMDCDFVKAQSCAMAGGAAGFNFYAGQGAKCRMVGTKWAAFPLAASGITTSNFASTTFVSGTGNQYIAGFPATIVFPSGTGGGITAIAVSKDGSTYTNVWTQASGAMGQSVQTHLDSGDYVAITFTGTQPGVTIIPDK